ncbi:MAG: response regulator [Verrucomicrobiales bacterium]|nr:response regulator [Verrucomicrobiales bacterium]
MQNIKRILLVDDNPEDLRVLAESLGNLDNGWKVDTTGGGSLALQAISARPFDVVVADFNMPGMTGEELLKAVMVEYPQTVRILLSGSFDLKATPRLMSVAHQYLCKPCDPLTLHETIASSLVLRDLLTSKDLQCLVSQIQALPSLPVLWMELIQELQKREPSIARIASIIARDLGLSTKLLQLVNSPFFALARPVIDLEEAVMHLGIETVKTLVLSLQTFSAFERLDTDSRAVKVLWSHSWSVGQLAQRIAQYEGLDHNAISRGFTAGLLHDVGKLVLQTGAPKQLAAVTALHREREIPLWRAEQEMFGCTHAEVGAYLLGLWGLPSPVVETVAMHHRPPRSSSRRMSAVLAVHVADYLTHKASTHPDASPIELDEALLAELNLSDRIDQWNGLAADLDGSPASAAA